MNYPFKDKKPSLEQQTANTLPPIEVYSMPCPRIRIPLLMDVPWSKQKKWMERYGQSCYLKSRDEWTFDLENMRAYCWNENKEQVIAALHKAGHMVIDMEGRGWNPFSRAL